MSFARRLNLPLLCARLTLAAAAALTLSQCAGGPTPKTPANVVVSVKEQKMAVYDRKGGVSRKYPISTSKFGLSDKPGAYGTPLGMHEVVAKIGHGAPSGAVFKSRHWTGEIIKPDSPGRDPIVSRIMWLRGLEKTNQNAYSRCIYIHGTAEEKNIGKPVSYGCIRMTSKDVIEAFNKLPIGSRVLITKADLPAHVPAMPEIKPGPAAPGSEPPIFLNPNQKPADGPMLAQGKRARQAAAQEVEGLAAAPQSAAPEPRGKVAPAKSKLISFRSKQVEPPTETVALRETPAITPKPLPGGGAVLYSAPGNNSGPGIVLKSKRHASQGYTNAN